jgi:hypothetical protein
VWSVIIISWANLKLAINNASHEQQITVKLGRLIN